MARFEQLDNPVWHSLHEGHRHFALTKGLAARYPREISSLVGFAEMTPDSFEDLLALAAPGEMVGLVSDVAPVVPEGWEVRRSRTIDQMVCDALLLESEAAEFIALTEIDVPEMIALAVATEPGPFAAQTYRMGRFSGLRSPDGRLMAMAGERMHLAGLTEISGVCTWPEFRGQGLAKALVVAGATRIIAEGNLPFLHVKGENVAKQLYERIGFKTRRAIHYTVMIVPGL